MKNNKKRNIIITLSILAIIFFPITLALAPILIVSLIIIGLKNTILDCITIKRYNKNRLIHQEEDFKRNCKSISQVIQTLKSKESSRESNVQKTDNSNYQSFEKPNIPNLNHLTGPKKQLITRFQAFRLTMDAKFNTEKHEVYRPKKVHPALSRIKSAGW